MPDGLAAPPDDGLRGRWKPIETAPKDQGIMVYEPEHTCDNGWTNEASIYLSHWSLGDALNAPHWTRDCIKGRPTHWMPLPLPPAALDAAGVPAEEA